MERLHNHQGQVLMTAPGDVSVAMHQDMQHLKLDGH